MNADSAPSADIIHVVGVLQELLDNGLAALKGRAGLKERGDVDSVLDAKESGKIKRGQDGEGRVALCDQKTI